MERTVMLILIGARKESAENVQHLLTGWGSLIKTRLGVHDDVLGECSHSGLIVLELVGPESKKDELMRMISLIDGVNAKMIQLTLPADQS